MVLRLLLSCAVASSLGAGSTWAHHTEAGRTHPVVTNVRITEPVLASNKPLPPGTYELVVTDQRPTAVSGEPNESQRWVEFVANGMVVAREIAEVFPADERPVGTSSSSAAPRAVVQRLKGDEFVRVAVNGDDARYLVHLPLSRP
jgi:hypothetical protein